ncbi:helix-turn-helix transcriptional regulator [Glycocaulis sp.]|uniref:helix-turn-helix transcriptional regulator n=1 Tax=Glycocaulis sp. TaxID=1969725 RepID=UPI003D1E2D67
MKSLRLFAVLDELRAARRPVAAHTMAERLGVSERTIYRDIASLQAMGAPVRGEAGLGYQLEPGYFLPPLQFSPDEMEAVMLALRLLSARNEAALSAAAARARGKIAAVLGGEGSQRFHNLPLLAVSRSHDTDRSAEQWEGLLRQAIRERRVVDLSYNSLSEHQSERRVWPLGLTVFDEAWLLTAWCEQAGAFRNFRLDRMRAATLTDTRFQPAAGQRFADYLASL